MIPFKPEESLRNDLRRYFERVSKDNERLFAEKADVPQVDGVSDTEPGLPGERNSLQ